MPQLPAHCDDRRTIGHASNFASPALFCTLTSATQWQLNGILNMGFPMINPSGANDNNNPKVLANLNLPPGDDDILPVGKAE